MSIGLFGLCSKPLQHSSGYHDNTLLNRRLLNHKLLVRLLLFLYLCQMDEQNLGLCLSPTLFSLSSVVRPSLSRRGSLKRPYALSPSNSPHLLTVANNKELNEHVVSSRCLAELIRSHDNLFKVAADMMQLCKFSHLEFGDPVPFQELGCDITGSGGYQTYINDCMATLAKVRG